MFSIGSPAGAIATQLGKSHALVYNLTYAHQTPYIVGSFSRGKLCSSSMHALTLHKYLKFYGGVVKSLR